MPRVSTVRLLTGLSMMCAAGLAVLVDVGRGADLDKVIMVTVMSVVAAGVAVPLGSLTARWAWSAAEEREPPRQAATSSVTTARLVIAAAIIAPAAPVLAFATLGPLLPAVYATAGFVAGGAATAASGLRLRQRERREGLELKQDSLWVGSPYLARASAISKGGTTG